MKNKAMLKTKKITEGTAIYGVTYTTAMGKKSVVNIKARTRAEAEKNAKNIVKSGTNFKAL